MKIEKLDECPPKNGNLVKVTEMGNVTEIQYMSKRNFKQTIQMLPGMNEYIDLSTGEVKDVTKHETRASQEKSLARTFKAIRGAINANVTDVSKARWLTLTYAENMTDPKQLYQDFEKFNKRLQYYCKTKRYGKPEYIVIMEPQGRGAWHAHLLYIWEEKAPYIANNTLSDLWGHGFVKISKLDNVDNVGAYLTAYLGDMEMTECIEKQGLKSVTNATEREIKKVKDKHYIKGARLKYYPAKFNMFRCSRGIKRPTESYMTEKNAEKKVSAATLTYEKTVRLTDQENNFESIINTKYYNSKRVKSQE